MALHNVVSQLANYKGILGWDAISGGPGATEVELYIKDHPIPVRRTKPTEVANVSQIDPRSNLETAFAGIFFSTPDILQVAISGWLITPTSSNQWSTSFGNISYGEVVANYISGEYSTTTSGALQRKDPDYYITPYGHRYNKPVIALWDCQYTVFIGKQTFSATLYLEK